MLEIDTCAGVAAVQTVGPSLTTHNPNRSCLRVILGEEQTAAESSVTLQPMSMVLKTRPNIAECQCVCAFQGPDGSAARAILIIMIHRCSVPTLVSRDRQPNHPREQAGTSVKSFLCFPGAERIDRPS